MRAALDIKICGITTADDARAALDAGADYLGFVIFPRSPRAVSGVALAQLVDAVDRPFRGVGVFVNVPRAEVLAIATDCRLHAVQLHGDECAEDFENLGIALWRAVWRRGDAWTPDPAAWKAADRFVVDASVPGAYGGTGRKADWGSAARLAAERRVMLAGGLVPGNVAEAVRQVHPVGVDVVSGVEAAPGVKDPARLRAFVAAARAA